MNISPLFSVKTRRLVFTQTMMYILLIIAAGFALVPIIWMVLSSFKTMEDIFRFPMEWLPKPFYYKAYPEAWAQRNFARYFFNSLFISVVITAGNIIICSMAGYALAKYRFFGRHFIFLAVLSTLMLPLQVTMVPLFLVIKQFHWQNTYIGIIVPFLVDAFGTRYHW